MADNVYIFTGPTLSPAEAAKTLEATYLPPVAQGDLYTLVQHRAARVVGIIDGYFNQVPAIWHKEVLWALSEGVHVFGAASMGALRAAELEAYGMQGVGKVFEAYRAGRLESGERFEDDDEVAVLHGPAETGYLAVSEALINMRATLQGAEREGIIDSSLRSDLTHAAKSAFYATRTWAWLIDEVAAGLLDENEHKRLREWIDAHAVDRKRLDALELLSTVAKFADRSPPPFEPAFRFEHTSQWRIAINAWDNNAQGTAEKAHRVLDELRLEPVRYAEIWHDAVVRALAIGDDTPIHEHTSTPRAAAGLGATHDTDALLTRSHTDPAGLRKIWASEREAAALERAAASMAPIVIERHMLTLMRERDMWDPLADRALAKAKVTHANPDTFSRLDELEKLQLLDWYFAQRQGADIPDSLEAYADALDLMDLDALHHLLYDEYLYVMSSEHTQA